MPFDRHGDLMLTRDVVRHLRARNTNRIDGSLLIHLHIGQAVPS
jgi:hypothetical protein